MMSQTLLDLMLDDVPQFEVVEEEKLAEFFKEWAHNNVPGKKGFQPKSATTPSWDELSLQEKIARLDSTTGVLTPEEERAVAGYCEDSAQITGPLREGMEPEPGSWVGDEVKGIDSAIEKSEPLPADLTVYRGISDRDAMLDIRGQVGWDATDLSFVSTTLDKKMAQEFGTGGGVVTIHLKAGQHVLWVQPVLDKVGDWFPDEYEVLLPRGRSYAVTREGNQVAMTMLDE